jgi:arsenate reductase (thioredoxin)
MRTDQRQGGLTAILFVCLHGSAKSLIAAEHLNRLAKSRGLAVRAESAGMEPDACVPAAVIAGLADDGIDVAGYRPLQATTARLILPSRVVTFACDISELAPSSARVDHWDDVPMVSDGYAVARAAIVERLEQLLNGLVSVR